MSNKSLVVLILFLLILCAGSFGLFYLKVNPQLAMSRNIFGGTVYNDPNLPNTSNSPFVEGGGNTNIATNQNNTVPEDSTGVNVVPVGNNNETVFPNNSPVISTNTDNVTNNTNTQVTATIKGILKKGSKGTEVKSLQSYLIKEGYLSGKADGSFGVMTETAVKKFQTEYNLTADGIVNGSTRDLLNELIAG